MTSEQDYLEKRLKQKEGFSSDACQKSFVRA